MFCEELNVICRSQTIYAAVKSIEYKRLARSAQLSPEIVQQISGHSCRVGAAQDLLALGASMPMIMNRGGWSKTDTVMRYLERYGITHLNPRTL